MAICDARYVFSFVDIGDYGSNNDSGVFRKCPNTDIFYFLFGHLSSSIGKSFFNMEMNLSNPEYIDNSHAFGQIPYYLVGGDAFILQQWLMKLYPGQEIQANLAVFNYRLSRAHRVKT